MDRRKRERLRDYVLQAADNRWGTTVRLNSDDVLDLLDYCDRLEGVKA